MDTRDELGFRGDGAGEDVDGDDDGDDFTIPEGSFPGRTAPPEP